MKVSGVTLNDVAQKAGVSKMTASRALRDEPNVSEEAKRRILKAARQLGYQRDPNLVRMMDQVRKRSRQGHSATLALVREAEPRDGLSTPAYLQIQLADLVERAAPYGYQIEEFAVGSQGHSPARLREILLARGIEGVIIAPFSRKLPSAKLDLSGFASCSFGSLLQPQGGHLCATNLALGILEICLQLRNDGHKRLGIAITKWIDTRVQFGYTSGLFQFHRQIEPQCQIPVLELPTQFAKRGKTKFCRWFDEHQPDAVISFHTSIPDWMAGMGAQLGENVSFIAHDWEPHLAQFAGIDQQRKALSTAAVDLVVSQLAQNEYGVPSEQRQILIPPKLVDGPTLMKRASLR